MSAHVLEGYNEVFLSFVARYGSQRVTRGVSSDGINHNMLINQTKVYKPNINTISFVSCIILDQVKMHVTFSCRILFLFNINRNKNAFQHSTYNFVLYYILKDVLSYVLVFLLEYQDNVTAFFHHL